MTLFSCKTLKSVSINNGEFKIGQKIINNNSSEPSFHPSSILVNKSSSSCNDINNSYAKLCVSDAVRNMNIKVFNLMSITNETYQIEWH